MTSPNDPTKPSTKTCDRCRIKKVKCHALANEELISAERLGEEHKCRGCFRGGHHCSYVYVHKKPGRPSGRHSLHDSASPDSKTLSSSPSTSYRHSIPQPYMPENDENRHTEPKVSLSNPSGSTVEYTSAPNSRVEPSMAGSQETIHAGPAFGSIFGSAQNIFTSSSDPLRNVHAGDDHFNFDTRAGQGAGWSNQPTLFSGDPFASTLFDPIRNATNNPTAPSRDSNDRSPFSNHTGLAASSSSDAFWTEADLVDEPEPLSRHPFNKSLHDPYSQPGPSNSGSVNLTTCQPMSSTSGYYIASDKSNGSVPIPTYGPQPSQLQSDVSGDEITSWSDICFFLSLYIRYQHPVLPLVHKPTFSQDILNRRDKISNSFRGLLCSIVAYTICQCPKNVMIARFTQAQLESLLARCRRSSRAAQIRQHSSPNLTVLISTIMDWITNIGTGKASLANVQMGEATRMLFELGLNRESPKTGLDFIELQLCRRCYWSVYTCDKTDASSGSPIALHDLEGSPPLPLEVDDEYMTPEGHLPQPRNRPSYMSGYVTVVKLFRILSECLVRQRTFTYTPTAGPDKPALIAWIEDAQARIREVLDSVPDVLRAAVGEDTWAKGDVFGTQKANVLITALCAEFALLDFKASIRPEADTKEEREVAAREAYNMLSSIPIEHLASNGESMRGKVLRIVLALLSATSEPGMYSQNVWDWWNMYSRVQYVQVIPVEEVARPSQAPSPVRAT